MADRAQRPAEAREPDAIDLLMEQHAHIEDLFRAVLSTTGDAKREAFDDLVRLLSMHETAEEEVIHPLARRRLDFGDAVVDRRLDEEQEAKRMLAGLVDLADRDDGKGMDASFDVELRRLRLAVLTHARKEERCEFGRLRHTAGEERLRTLAGAVRAAEALAPTRPHPSLRSPLANAALGPALAVADRVRDALREVRRDGE
ncbi:MAG TPA: hemerythrin domain-containing protein [Planosporangium sp.]|nr:hemerythrin domain-containing protein [Planosporangium sp.]